MLVKIRRQKIGGQPYTEEFQYAGSGKVSVSCIIDAISVELMMSGKPRISWDCSCMEAKCGGCAMVINGKPGLACNTFIDCSEDAVLTLEPLKKFPVIEDLSVDRSAIFEHQKEAGIFLGEYKEAEAAERPYRYNAAKCLKCGLCLEICPNYKGGKTHFGPVMLHDAYLQASASGNRTGEMKKAYKEHFAGGCSSCLACSKICPQEISTLASISYMVKKIK